MRHFIIRACTPLLLALSLVAGLAHGATEPVRRAITHEDVWLMQRPGALGSQPGRPLVHRRGGGAVLRRRAAAQRPLDHASRRQRPAAPTHLEPQLRGRPGLEPGLHSHRFLGQARGRRGSADLRAGPRGRRGAARDQLAGGCQGAALQPGRPVDPVRRAHASGRGHAGRQPQGRRRPQGAQVQRPRLRLFPHSPLGPLARRVAPVADGPATRWRLDRPRLARGQCASQGAGFRRPARQRGRNHRGRLDA